MSGYEQSSAGSFEYSCSLLHGASFKLILFSFCLLFSLYLNDLWCVHAVYVTHTVSCEMFCGYTVLTDVTQTEDWHHHCVNVNHDITQTSFTFHPPDRRLQHKTRPDFSLRVHRLSPLTVTTNSIFHHIVLMGVNLTFALFLLLLASYNENSILLLCARNTNEQCETGGECK